MSDEWRVKRYYKPRVLIGVSDTLENTYPAILLCLDGGELNVLRNLLDYAHRRATWVSEYHDSYYLAPDNDEWDELEAVIAELEDKLMGCNDFLTVLEDILAATQCACERASAEPRVTPAIEPIVRDYMDDGELIAEDVYGDTQTGGEDRCAVAQLAFALAYEMLTEVLQPIQTSMNDVLLPLVMVELATWIGPGVLAIPTGSLLALLWNLVEAQVQGQLQHVQNEYLAAKEELICAVYEGLATDYRSAENLAVEVIQAMSLSPIEMILLHCCYCPWVFKLCQQAWDNQTDWAVLNVTPDYCTACWEQPYGNDFEFEWPPCANGYFLDGGVCYQGHLSFNGDVHLATQRIWVENLETYNQITIWADWYSCFGSGFTVAQIVVQKWNTGTQQWDTVDNLDCTNNVAIGELNEKSEIGYVTKDAGTHRITIAGAPGQHEYDPYPAMFARVRVLFEWVAP